MLYLFLFVIEIIVLYTLSRRVVQGVYRLTFRITTKRNWSMYLFAALFLPGTFIHEISHFLAALLLLVPVGKLELFPKIKDDGEGVDLGSVAIAKTDPVRRFLIGVAPLIFGILIIFSMVYLVLMMHATMVSWKYLLAGFFIFEIANSMFASKKDLEGALQLLVLTIFMGIIIYVLGVRFQLPLSNKLLAESITGIFKLADIYLLTPIVIDSIILVILKITK